jgi:hypothetical protein
MTDLTDLIQTREERGDRIRARLGGVGVISRLAGLEPAERARALEYLEAAHTADRKENLGGARLLDEAARSLDTPGPISLVLRRASHAFVHPPAR